MSGKARRKRLLRLCGNGWRSYERMAAAVMREWSGNPYSFATISDFLEITTGLVRKVVTLIMCLFPHNKKRKNGHFVTF